MYAPTSNSTMEQKKRESERIPNDKIHVPLSDKRLHTGNNVEMSRYTLHCYLHGHTQTYNIHGYSIAPHRKTILKNMTKRILQQRQVYTW